MYQYINILKLNWLIFFLLIAQLTLHAQDDTDCKYKVEGKVYNRETGEVLPFVTIQIKGTTKGVVADETGYFYLNTICEEEFDLIFSHIGFKQVVHHHDVHHRLPNIYLAPEGIALESVIIEGEMPVGDLNSGTISRISAEELTLESSETFGEIVGNITGVSLIKTGQNVVKPVIHGLHSNRILIINNGVRHEYQSWGQDHAPELDPSHAENIQVIKGAATVRYGPDALGGVIVMNPPQMDLLTDFSGEAGITGRSNGRAIAGNLKLQKGFHKVAFLAEGSYQMQGDLSSPDYYLTNTAKREGSFAFGTRYHTRNWDITGYYSHFNQELGILRGSVTENLEDLEHAIANEPPANTGNFDYEIGNPRQNATHDMLKMNGSFNRENSILNIQYAFQSNSRQEYDVRRGTNNQRPSIDLRLNSHTVDIDWKHPEYLDWLGSIGIQGLYQDNDNKPGTNTAPFVPNYNNYRIGAFIIESKQFSDLILEWGIRYDYLFTSVRGRHQNNNPYSDELTYQNITATLGLEKQFTNNSVFRSNIGTAWRPPSVSELYSFGKHQASIEYGLLRYEFDSNDEIMISEDPEGGEKDVDAEVGIKWINTYSYSNKDWDSELTGFVNYIDNYIYTQPVGITQTVRGAFPYFIYRQTNALLAGLDLSVVYNHNRQLSSHFMGSYLFAKDLLNDSYFIGLPPAVMSYSINYDLKKFWIFNKASVKLDIDYTFEPFYKPSIIPVSEIRSAKEEGQEIFRKDSETFDMIEAPDGYLLANLVLYGEMKNWTLMVKVDNIFNKEYRSYTDRMRYFADDIGRNFILSVRYNF